jgi:mono/diheme cytochrome c family protein
LQNVKRTLIFKVASVNSQLAKPKFALHPFTFVIIGVLFVIGTIIWGGVHLSRLSSPYAQDVLALPGNASRGYEIFQINCAGCHGKLADGSVGPSLHEVSKRKSPISLIEQVVSGKTPPMPKFQPDPQAMADLLIYLEHL